MSMQEKPGKRRLGLMPEVLPAPNRVEGQPSNVRARALARLKILTAVGAGLAVSCGKTKGLADSHKPGDPEPYGVVDPMPRPTCFEGPQPTITAAFVTEAKDAGAAKTLAAGDGARLVDVNIAYTQSDIALGNVTPAEGLAIIESKPSPKGLRLLVRAAKPKDGATGADQRSISVATSCPMGPTTMQITLAFTADNVTAQVYAY